jgi:flagellar L-ring protein precursor FlgH
LAIVATASQVVAGPKKPATAESTPQAGAPAGPASDNYDELFLRYLQAARTTKPAGGPNIGWMSGLGADLRARQVNDIVTINVVESIVGTGSADSALDKKGSGTAAVTKLFGVEKKLPAFVDPTNLVGAASTTSFKGGGTTNRALTLTATMTARVTEVLPNGDLVLEGARELDINGDRQIVVLSGVVRPNSVSKDNSVPSTAIGQLRIRYFGKGLIKDNLRPGILIRILNKVF